MITNSSVTIYHKSIRNHLERWTRYNYENVWFFGGKGAGINKGYADANDVDVRIPYSKNEININNFAIGDIIVQGTINFDITSQQVLKNYQVYNITSINNNNFGNNPHVHIGGK
jgi:hypothetical protein